MGLLSKAAVGSPPVLDEMGKVLCSRILSLAEENTRAETAVTLLKAYAAFQAGLCLALRNGFYSAYASVGMGSDAVIFPDNLLNAIPGKKYYSVDYIPPEDMSPSALQFWAFPLDDSKDMPASIFMAGGNPDLFQSAAVEAVLAAAGEAFLPLKGRFAEDENALLFAGSSFMQDGLMRGAKKSENEFIDIELETSLAPEDGGGFNVPVQTSYDREVSVLSGVSQKTAGGLLKRIAKKQASEPSTALEKELMASLNSGHAKFGAIQGLVLEALEQGDFSGQLGSAVSSFGDTRDLGGGRCLVLFGAALDGELLARHLIRSIAGKNVFSFHAEDPRNAFNLVKPYLNE